MYVSGVKTRKVVGYYFEIFTQYFIEMFLYSEIFRRSSSDAKLSVVEKITLHIYL